MAASPPAAPGGAAHDWRVDCAICLNLLPIEGDGGSFYDCFGKRICKDCAAKCDHDTFRPLEPAQSESLQWLQEQADEGNAEAQVLLGDAYRQGKRLPKSLKRALELYHSAAAQGHVLGQMQMGWSCLNGNDSKNAFLWYKRAADRNYPNAQCNLGTLFYHGNGVAQSFEEAVKWFRLAAAQNDASALFNLGACYENGHGVVRDLDEALRLYKRAARQGHAEAKAIVCDLEAHGR
jgi:hypothetical protein